jgi:hypothetical protein
MDLSKIAIEDDIYLYYWIYYMKPIFALGDVWERFSSANTWVKQEEKSPLITLPLRVTL